jgi:hypothetical protein
MIKTVEFKDVDGDTITIRNNPFARVIRIHSHFDGSAEILIPKKDVIKFVNKLLKATYSGDKSEEEGLSFIASGGGSGASFVKPKDKSKRDKKLERLSGKSGKG